MNGLLGNPLFNVGLGLLANNQPSTQPVNPWAGVLGGLQNAQQFQAQTQQNQLQQMLYGAQMGKLSREEREALERAQLQAEQKAALEEAIKSMPPELQAMARANPEPFLNEIAKNQFGNGAAPKTRDRWNGTESIQEQWDPATKKWTEIGRGPRWQPESTRKDAEYYTPVSTPNGLMRFNARTGAIEPLLDEKGMPLMKAADDPTNRGQIAAATESGKLAGTAAIDLDRVRSNADYLTGVIDKAISHPGREAATGGSSLLNPVAVPGTDRKDFLVVMDQVKGAQFLQAYENLKGGGQITEIEGKKAEEAKARMNTAQSEKEFLNALIEFRSEIARLTAIAEHRAKYAGLPASAPSGYMQMIPGAPPVGGAVNWSDL